MGKCWCEECCLAQELYAELESELICPDISDAYYKLPKKKKPYKKRKSKSKGDVIKAHRLADC